VAGAAFAASLSLAGVAQERSYESLDACRRIPAAAVAAAVSGRPVDDRPINVKGFDAARCVYGIDIAGTRRAFVVWVNPVGDFEGLREAAEPPVTEVKGVGDDAYATTDSDTKRIQLTARLRGKVTVQVTGDRMEWVQAVARAALSKF
jgi:hypothetical protein